MWNGNQCLIFKDKHKFLEGKLKFKGLNNMFNSYEMELYSAYCKETLKVDRFLVYFLYIIHFL